MIVAFISLHFCSECFAFVLSRRFTTHPAQDPMDSISKHKPDTEDLVAMGSENHPVTFVSQTMDNDNQHQAPDIWHKENNVDVDEQKLAFNSLETLHLGSVHVRNKEDIWSTVSGECPANN